jgi:predicted acyl esterase
MGIFRFQSKVPRRAALLAVSVLALAAPASAAKHKRWTNYERPATYTVKHVANVAITMRDGVVLRANLDLPDAPGRFPRWWSRRPTTRTG